MYFLCYVIVPPKMTLKRPFNGAKTIFSTKEIIKIIQSHNKNQQK
jgi:hypothetical protein